jgi:peptidoglycan/LPS O-acetylase OafA/YrhL
MSVRSVITMVSVLIGFVVLATPAAADVAVQQADTPAYTLSTGRFWSLIAAAFGLIGLVTGLLVRTRLLAGARTRRRNAGLALAAGLAGSVIGGLVVAFADGGPGSGSGIVGGYLAVLIGVVAMTLGVLGLNRSHRPDRPLSTTSGT